MSRKKRVAVEVKALEEEDDDDDDDDKEEEEEEGLLLVETFGGFDTKVVKVVVCF